jgi:hypothetical protein
LLEIYMVSPPLSRKECKKWTQFKTSDNPISKIRSRNSWAEIMSSRVWISLPWQKNKNHFKQIRAKTVRQPIFQNTKPNKNTRSPVRLLR